MERIAVAGITDWQGPFDPATRAAAVGSLEAGQVLFLPHLAFPVAAEERRVLSAGASDGRHKNLSYDPKTGTCRGTSLTGADAALLAATLARFSAAAAGLLAALLPYGTALERARTSFRPEEIAGRKMPWRKDDTRLHVDAFPSRPLAGRRILRVFSNVDPAGTPRRWQVGEAFEAHAARFLGRLRPPIPGTAPVLAALGITRGRRTAYDHMMLQLHDAAKRDLSYQAEARGEAVAFPPGSTWAVYTDQVPHAALSGRNAFEQTFHLDPAAMAEPARAPLKVLERLSGRALV